MRLVGSRGGFKKGMRESEVLTRILHAWEIWGLRGVQGLDQLHRKDVAKRSHSVYILY